MEEVHYTYIMIVGSGADEKEKTVPAHGFNKFIDFSVPIYDFSIGDATSPFILHPG